MNKWLALAMTLAIACAAVAQEQPAAQEQPGAQDFRAGTEAVKKNDFDGMIVSFEKALAANPTLFLSHYYLGFAYRSKQNWAKCGDNFSQFLQKLGDQNLPTEKAHATKEGGLCFVRADSYGKAIPLLQTAAAANPNEVAIQNALGISLMRDNREEEAEVAFAKVIQLKPEIANPYYFAGRVNFYKQDLTKAEPRLMKYLELDANGTFVPDAHFLLGSIAYQKAEQGGDKAVLYPTVKTHLTKFLEGRPNAPQTPDALYILGYVAAQEEDDTAAKGYFERFLRLRPDGPQAEEAKRFLAELTG